MTGSLDGQEIFLGAPRFAEGGTTWPAGASERSAALEAEGKTSRRSWWAAVWWG